MAVKTDIIDLATNFTKEAKTVIKIDAAYLFGSSINGKDLKHSDIDLAIVSPDFSGFGFADRKKLNPLILKFGASLEVHPFKKSDFLRKDPFIKEILKTGIKVA
ncbi:nucleotidyltransferase domain-containing protein [candidate division TA06 bacterium]|uniref:Nucleotidyltransferase domain-containing protein n=1 Tax=candidate division TA06 bacterium TaxID=2250710 RepID=A0A933MIJ7_UNCT6|nr:nucleotidyltransferase domain-containing protein [candidate division TA06 bacterium]